MPLTESLDYASVRRAFKRAKELYPDRFGAAKMADFARTANQETGTTAFDAGLVDNPIKRTSAWVDDMLAPVAQQSAGFFGELAGTVDPELRTIGEDVGRSLPRAAIELGVAATGVPGAVIGGASAAAKGYTDTGSPLVGAISGLTTGAMPGVGRLGAKVAAKALAPTAVARGEGLGAQIIERGAESIGANTFAGLLGEASRQGTSLAMGQGLAPVGTKEHIAEMVIGQVPFAVLDLVGAVKPPRTVEGPNGPQREIRSETERQRIIAEVDLQKAKTDAQERARGGVELDMRGRGVEGSRMALPDAGAAPAPAGGPPIPAPADSPTLAQPSLPGTAPEPAPLPNPFELASFRNDPQINQALETFKASHPDLFGGRKAARRAVQPDPRGTAENQFLFQAKEYGGRSEESLRELLDTPIKMTDPDALEKVNRLAFMYDRLVDAALSEGNASHLASAMVRKELSRESMVRQMINEAEGRGLDGIEFGERVIRRLTKLTKDVADVALAKEDKPKVLEALRDVELFDRPENSHLLDGLRDMYDRVAKRLESLTFSDAGRKAYDELVGSGLIDEVSLGHAVEFLKTKQTVTEMYYTGGKGKGNDPLLRPDVDEPVTETKVGKDKFGRRVTEEVPVLDPSGKPVTARTERAKTRELLAMQDFVSDRTFGTLSTMLRKRIKQLSGIKDAEGVGGGKKNTEGGTVEDVSGVFVTPEQAAADAAGLSKTERFVTLLADEMDIPISTWAAAAREATGASKIKYAAKLKAIGDDLIQALKDGTLFIRTFKDGKDRLVGKKDVKESSTLAFLAKKHGYDTSGSGKGTSKISEFIQTTVQPALEWMIAHKEKGGDLGGRKAAVTQPRPETGGVPRPVTDADLVAKHPELDRRAFLGSSVVAAESFFRTYFGAQGMDPVRVERLTDIAMRVAATFDKVSYVRLAELTGDKAYAVHVPLARDLYKSFVGLNPELIKEVGLTEWSAFHFLGHELAHANIYRALNSPADIQDMAYVRRALQSAIGMAPEGRASVTGSWLEAAIPERKNSPEFNNARRAFIDERMRQAALDPHEMLADLSGILATAIASPSKNKWLRPVLDKLEFSSAAEQDFAKGFYLDVFEAIDALEKWTNYRNPGLGTETRKIAENLRQTLSTTEAVGEMVDAVNTMRLMHPERYLAYRADSRVADIISDVDLVGEEVQFAGRSTRALLKDAREALGMGDAAKWEAENGVQPGWMKRTFLTAANLAEEYPMLRPLVDLVFGFRALTNEAANDILRPFMAQGTKMGRSVIDAQASGLRTVTQNPKANRVAAELGLLKNERGEVLDTEFMLRYAKEHGLGDKEANDVVQFHRNVEQVMPRVVKRALEAVKEDGAIMIGTRVMLASRGAQTRITWKQAKMYGDVLMNVALNKVVGPDKLAFAENLGRQLSGTTGFGERMSDVAKSYVDMMRERAEVMGDKPWYMPEVRLGRYYVYVPQDGPGPTPLWGYETKVEALRKLDALRKDGREAKVYDKTDRENEFVGVRPDVAEHWSKIESAVFERAIADMPVDQQMYLRDAYQPGEAVTRELKSRGSEKHLQQRQLAEGREELDMVSGFLHYVTGVTTGLAKQHVKNMSALMLADPELLANPKIHKLARQHVQNVLYPTGKELTALKQLNFLYFMGLNPASMVAELSQTFSSYVPYLIEQGSSVGGAYKNQMWAFKEMFGAARKGRFSKEEYDQAMKWAQEHQIVDFGIMSEVYSLEDESVVNLTNLAKGQALVEPGRLVTNAVNWAAHYPRLAYSTVTRMNSRVAFLGAYKHARDKGMKVDQAREFASHATRVTMFGGGLAARPVGMFANLGKVHGIMGLAYSLQSYTFGMYGSIARVIHNSIAKGVAGPQKAAARKAAGVMLGTQFVLAGALGLPMSMAVLSVVNELFPEAELERKLRTGTAELFREFTGADEKMGSVLSDIFLHGAADQTGMDISGRVGLGTFLGVSPYNGLSWENLAGPTGSLLASAVQAGQAAVKGEGFEAARKILPRSMKNVLEAYDHTAFRDPRGRLLMEPTQADTVLAALGLGPAELKRLKQASRLQRQTEDMVRQQRARDYGKVADELAVGNAEGARALLAELSERSGGMLDTRSAARSIAELTFARQVPDDPTRGVDRITAESVGRLRRSMGVTPGQEVSEMERAEQVRRMMMDLGVRSPRPGRSARRSLMGIDALLTERPDLTYGEARGMVR